MCERERERELDKYGKKNILHKMRKSTITPQTTDFDVFNSECIDFEVFLNNKSNLTTTETRCSNVSVNKVLKRISRLNNDITNNNNNNVNITTNTSINNNNNISVSSNNNNNNNSSSSSSGSGMHEFEISKESLIKLNYEAARNLEINNEFKKLLRVNTWPITHETRKYLWQSLLLINEDESRNYYDHVQTLFGSANQSIEIDFPKFVNFSSHSNFYFLNSTGRFRVKRLLCVYAYHYPDVTYSPTIISVTSLLLHYMHEHEVYMAICNLLRKKDHLVETKMSWDANGLVFSRLLKIHCVSIFLHTHYSSFKVKHEHACVHSILEIKL